MFYEFKTVSHLVSLTLFFCLLDTDSFSCSEHGHLALCVIHLFNQCVFLMLEGGPENCTTEKITLITDYYLWGFIIKICMVWTAHSSWVYICCLAPH